MIRRIVVGCVMGVWLCGAPSAARAQAPAVEPGRTVAGVVVESDTRAPIAGAVVGTVEVLASARECRPLHAAASWRMSETGGDNEATVTPGGGQNREPRP